MCATTNAMQTEQEAKNGSISTSSIALHLLSEKDACENVRRPRRQQTRRQRSTGLLLSDNEVDSESDNNPFFDGNNDHNGNCCSNSSSSNNSGEGNFCAEMIKFPVVACQGSSNFADQLDLDQFMTCRHPLDLMTTMFHESDAIENQAQSNNSSRISNNNRNNQQEQELEQQSSGYHAIPRSCEYCGSCNIEMCSQNPNCTRPCSYFPKERPPFSKN